MTGFAAIPNYARAVALAVICVATTAAGADLTFDLHVKRGSVAEDMRLIRVKQGDVVTLRWSSDQAIVLHLHGYDIEANVVPGSVATMAFTARATGRFPVEVHIPHKGSSGHGEAPLVRIEVYPK